MFPKDIRIAIGILVMVSLTYNMYFTIGTTKSEAVILGSNHRLKHRELGNAFETYYKPDKLHVAAFDSAYRILDELGVVYLNDVPLVMWTFLIGPPITDEYELKYMEALKDWCKRTRVHHIHINQENIMDFKVAEWPSELQDSLPTTTTTTDDSSPVLLSGNHISDYLQSYFGFYFGGGFTEIRAPNTDVLNYRDLLVDLAYSPTIAIIGGKLSSPGSVDCSTNGCLAVHGTEDCCRKVKESYEEFVSNVMFGTRPGNIIFKDILDNNNEFIKSVPAQEWDYGEDSHPIARNDLLGNISFILQEKYINHVAQQEWNVNDLFHGKDYFDQTTTDTPPDTTTEKTTEISATIEVVTADVAEDS